MTIAELIEELDGYGLVMTDDDLIEDRIIDLGWALSDKVTITTPGGYNANTGEYQPPRVVSG